MTAIDLEVYGLDETVLALKEFGYALPDEIADSIQTDGFAMYYALATYPPPPDGSTYVRTYYYQDSIDLQLAYNAGAVELLIHQAAPYAIYLRGDLEGYPGAWMHVGRWRTLQNIVDAFLPVIKARLQARIDALIARLFGGD